MKIYNITNIKEFTKKLFIEDTFDNFLVVEANFVTSHSVLIDGTKSVEADGDEYVTWKEVKAEAFNVIKGKVLPKSFKIVLKLTNENTINTLKAISLKADLQAGLYINIKYFDDQINVISGTSTSTFELSKDLSNGFEIFLEKFFAKKEIEFEKI